MYDIFYLTICSRPSTKPRTGLSYSGALYMCVTTICQFQTVGHRGILLKDMLWNVASSYTETEFQYAMKEIKKVSKPAYSYLAKIDP